MNMLDEELRSSTLRLVAEMAEMDRAKIPGSDRLREDLGMDSLSSLELLSSLGEKLRIEFEIEDAMDIRTVDDACAFVERQRRAARA